VTVKCANCHVEFDSNVLLQSEKNGSFKCPVCGEKIPSTGTEFPSGSSKFPPFKVLITSAIALILVSLGFYYFVSRNDSSPQPPPVNKGPQISDTKKSNQPPVSPSTDSRLAGRPVAIAPVDLSNVAAAPLPDKKQIVKQIAAEFHKGHTYTLQGDFVCLDMAIDVWNQLITKGIDAKIMGGNIKENIMTWNYRQLLIESNHAWVVAKLSPSEKVAVETTAGIVIEKGMKNSAPYFRGIEFNNPAEIKKFDALRKKGKSVCQDAKKMVDEWNSNIAGKQRPSAEIIAKKAQVEQRKSDCESAWNDLEEFKSRAIFY
jgi:hypothetical protein